MRRATVIGSVALGASLLLAGAPLVASAADTTLYSPDSLAIVGMPYSVSGLDCVSEGSGPASVSVSFNGTTVSPTVEDDGSWQTDYIPTAADVDTLTVSATCDTSTSSWPYDGYDVEILAAPETPTGSITDVAVDGCTLRASVTTGGRGNAFSAQVAPASGQAWDWAFYELPIGSKGRAQADGAFRGTLTIPAGTAPGTYTLTSTGTVSGRSAQQEITVVAGGGATRPGLPSSGD